MAPTRILRAFSPTSANLDSIGTAGRRALSGPLAATLLVALMAQTATAQRGGRGPSEFIKERHGSYFTTTTLPAPDEKGKVDFGACEHVKTASDAGHLSVLYLYDPTKNPEKHPAFEQTVLGHDAIQLLLRSYQCARVDLSQLGEDYATLREQSPLFIVCSAKGEVVGEVDYHDYRVQANPFIALLERGAARHGKLPVKNFVKLYRKFINEYQVYEGRSKTLTERQGRLGDSKKDELKRRDLEKEALELEQMRKSLVEDEAKLLELARIPPRLPGAVLLGQRERGGR